MNLELTHFLQQFNHPAFLSFVKFLNFFDTPEFLFVLLPIVWVTFGKKRGLKFFYILLLSGALNQLLKLAFHTPRPFIIDPSVGIIQVSGYSFPSGAAQTSALLTSIVLYYWKNKIKWILAPTYWLMICFSRVYLGVHFLRDVIAGTLVGALLLPVYIYIFPKIEKWFSKFTLRERFYLSSVSFLFLLLISTSKSFVQLFSAALGLTVGYFLSESAHFKKQPKSPLFKFAFEIPILILGLFLISIFAQKLPISDFKTKLFTVSSLLGLWVGLTPTRLTLVWKKLIK